MAHFVGLRHGAEINRDYGSNPLELLQMRARCKNDKPSPPVEMNIPIRIGESGVPALVLYFRNTEKSAYLAQLVEQHLCFSQIYSVKAFGEPL
jgi:hypothetical protein